MSEFHVEVGSYALDALDPAERAAFEEHLATCETCPQELTEFAETIAELGAAVAVPPPPELRASVLDAIRQVRPLPPEEPMTDQPAPPVVDELAARRAQRRSRLLTLAVAAVTVVALALGGWVYALNRQQQAQVAQAQAMSRLLSAPDARTYPVTLADGRGAGSFVVSKSLDQAAFVSSTVPSAPQGRTYQLWTITSAAPLAVTPNATFPGGSSRAVFFTGDVRNAVGAAISEEAAGGSTTGVPTQPILTAQTF